MRIRVLQHVPYEGPAAISEWASSRGHLLEVTAVYQDKLPPVEDLEFLIVMGGPMNVYQEEQYPWLAAEKTLIKGAIEAGKVVLGICLGAQLLTDALGGKVSKNKCAEIGWFPVELTDEGHGLELLDGLPTRFIALHWHGDTFSIPEHAVHFASSAACKNQAFAYDEGRVVGLQFHLEETRESLALLIENAGADLVPGEWIETSKELLAPYAPFQLGNDLLARLLDRMVAKVTP
ncbi:MAG: type 1 glutamine amidotransferase [Actinobacteria bacterium]|nr:type 1 glutamine amidotransferase [Actinomycetota bacterium]